MPSRRGSARRPVDGRGRDRRDGDRRRGGQDGPAARGAVRLARLVGHRRRRERGRGGRDRTRGAAHVAEEPDLAERVAEAHAAGRLRATTDGAAAAAGVGRRRPDRPGDARRRAAARLSLHGCRRRCDRARRPRRLDRDLRDDPPGRATRGAATRPRLEAATGLVADRDFFVAFSPERLFTGAVFRNLATYPKLVGGIGPASTERAARFYASVLDAEVVAMSTAEAAELEQARRHDLPRPEHRLRQRVRPLRRPDRGGRPRGDRGPRTASRTATSTSPASAWAATASRSTRTSSCRAPRRWSSSRCRGG